MIQINLLAGPSVGKSTFAARLFVALKEKHVNVELVREYPKDLTWENRISTLQNQVYVFAKQHHMIWRLKDKVDVCVVEGSLLNSLAYFPEENENLKNLLLSEFHKFDNMNFYLERKFEYQQAGRLGSENDAIFRDDAILTILKENSIDYTTIDPKDREVFDVIVQKILDKLKWPGYYKINIS